MRASSEPGNGAIRMNTVEAVARGHLCHSCGACAVVCPIGAISYYETTGGHLLPLIDQGRCTSCGRCLQVCPGMGLTPRLAELLPSDPFVGEARECFVGRATDRAIYASAQSGGVATALLCHGLQSGTLGAALVTAMRQAVPPRPVAYLATSATDVVRAQKSKYAPVAVLAALHNLGSVDGPIAVVGLPCQVHGLRTLMETDSRLRTRIALVIGLVCDRTLTSAGLEYLTAQAMLPDEPSMIIFRDKAAGGYPGAVHVFGHKGGEAVLPSAERTRIKNWFTPARCLICFDKLNILADITVGDPWGIAQADHQCGESAVVARTQAGVNALVAAHREAAISLLKIPYCSVVRGQKIDVKRKEWRSYAAAWQSFKLERPSYRHSALDLVRDEAKPKRRFRRELGWALSLDQHSSRDALLQAVRTKVRISKVISAPPAVARRGFRTLRHLRDHAFATLDGIWRKGRGMG